jgi:hypothetical protein
MAVGGRMMMVDAKLIVYVVDEGEPNEKMLSMMHLNNPSLD